MTRREVPLAEIVSYLDQYLRTSEVPDDGNALNGLQVENRGLVSRLVAAVDASLATIEGLGSSPSAMGKAAGAAHLPALLIVHHGLFWEGHRALTGRRLLRVRALLDQDAALYASHIPLDLHPLVGNNAVLAARLGLENTRAFGVHKGVAIGITGSVPAGLGSRATLLEALAKALAIAPSAVRLIPGGPERISRVGVITGAGGSAIAEAREAGCDSFITGEGAAHTYFDAMELGLNVFYAGHYATETVGVNALAQHLGERFSLPWEFHDHPTGM